MRLLLPAFLSLLLAGCATTMGEPETPSPALAKVRLEPEAYFGQEVLWGGTIAEVSNRERETCIEVVARELAASGRPLDIDQSQGRFIACVPGFLDPVIYSAGRELTVRGTVQGTETGAVGDYDYRYPLVEVASHRLWQPRPEVQVIEPDPFWYYPWPAWHPYRAYPYPFAPFYRPYED